LLTDKVKYKRLVGTKTRQKELKRLAAELCGEILNVMRSAWTIRQAELRDWPVRGKVGSSQKQL